MKIAVVVFSVWAAVQAAPSGASGAAAETPYLVVRDGTGALSGERLRAVRDRAAETLDSVLSFWSADAQISRFGKIRIIVDGPLRGGYTSVFFWDFEGGRRVRAVRIYGADVEPQMLAHKLTSAIFPQPDKLIRNMMGILTEARVGNRLTFPMCGFDADVWVAAFWATDRTQTLEALGANDESWGMSETGGNVTVSDRRKQHQAYAMAGSFASFLASVHGKDTLKKFHRLSQEKPRPWREAFGAGLDELEREWHRAVTERASAGADQVRVLSGLLSANAAMACLDAQKITPLGTAR